MPGKHNYYKKMAEGGKADMSAKPEKLSPEPDRIQMPTPMTDAKENTANTGIMSNTTQQIA